MDATPSEVREALEQEQLIPFFQPIVDLRTGRLSGFEVLARWLHPVRGAILPDNFVSLAESQRLIPRLTRQIVHRSFVSASTIPANLFITINVSPSEMSSEALAPMLCEEADRTGFKLNRLIIEVTEAVLVDDLSSARDAAIRLQEMGCRLALDDFGTGHSSLSYLQQLPFYGLKIDRSFISPMVHQRQSRKIVASVVGLSASLGMRSVGEGVETDEQADMLFWLGCDMAQGWLYGRPEPAEQLPRLIAAKYSPARIATNIEGDSLHPFPSQNLAQLQAIYRSVPVGLCFLDTRQQYVSLNHRYAEFIGKPMSAFVGKTVGEVCPKVYPSIQPLLARALRGESIVNEELPLPAAPSSPSEAPMLVSYEPVRDEVGEVFGVSVSILDISDRHPAENLAPPADQDDSPPIEDADMPWIRDARGYITEVSSRWLALTGMTREQSLNLGSLEAIHPDDRPRALGALREAVQNRTPIDATCRVRAVDGSYKWLRARGYPRYDLRGEFLGWYGGAEDIEERKGLERALHEERSSPN